MLTQQPSLPQSSFPASAIQSHAPAADTVAQVELDPGHTRAVAIKRIDYFVSATPAEAATLAAACTTRDGSGSLVTTTLTFPVVASGFLDWSAAPVVFAPGRPVTVALSAAGDGISGRVQVMAYSVTG